MQDSRNDKRYFLILTLSLIFLYGCQVNTLVPTSTSEVADATLVLSTVTPTISPSPTLTLTSLPTLTPESDFIKGAWFVDWGLGDGVATHDGKIVLSDIIRPLGANWIALAVPCHMDIAVPDVIDCNVDDSMPDTAIVTVTKTAHSLGLRVALFPFVLDVAGVPDNWSNNLNFGSSEHTWSTYFDAYADQLLHYAELSEQNQIDLLIIGGEQAGAQPQEKHWRSLIEQVRGVYHGPISYEAWCQHFDSVHWWDAVDYIGINFYCFPLASSANPKPEEVKKNYLKFLNMVKTGTSHWSKPIIFTEIGYQSTNGVAQIAPFGYPPVLLDTEEQGVLVQSFFDALKEFGNDDHWLKGMFWYNFSSNPLQGGLGDLNFLPHNKPAEAYLRAFYTGQPVTPVPLLRTQIEEDAIAESYWLFDDDLENGTRIGIWAGEGKQTIVADPLGERGNVFSIKNIHDWEGLQLDLAMPANMHEYDYIELYLYAPRYEPNLEIRFDDSVGQYIPRRLFIRSYIDHEPLLDHHWHRILIPVDLLFPDDRTDIPSQVSAIYFQHFWPGQTGPITFFIDGVRLIKIKP